MRNVELDRILDEALARYSSTEPLAGLEQRVMNRVHTERAAPRIGRFRFGRWAPAVGVALVAAVVVGVWWEKPIPPPRLVAQASWPVPQPAQTRTQAVGFRKKSQQVRRPILLSREERALLALVARAPDQAREAFLDLQRQSAEPIQIAKIRIEPIRSDDAK